MSQYWIEPTDLEIENLAQSAYAEEAAKTASYYLWALSGRKYSGTTTVTERYTREDYPDTLDGRDLGMSVQNTEPVLTPSGITNSTFGDLIRLRLRGRPVQQIISIQTPDGNILPPESYYLSDHAIVNFYGLSIPYDIEITYTYGAPPPAAGRAAARELARQLLYAWTNDDQCTLPARVTSVSRQGVSYTILDSQDFIDDLRTGIYLVDLFLKTSNPEKARARAKVFSPDIPRGRRYTPKPVKLPVSDTDISVGTSDVLVTFTFDTLGSDYLATGAWTPELVLRSWGDARSQVVPNSVALDLAGNQAIISIPRSTVLSVVGTIDPGTWDLYVHQDGAYSHVVSSNIKLAYQS